MAASRAISVTEPVAVPRGRTRLEGVIAWMLVSILLGVAAGASVYSLVEAGSEAMVSAYEQAWASLQPTDTRVRISGTGPGLAWVAEQQANWAENAVTGTGPGLVTLAEMQAGYGTSSEPTGTGPGLTRLGKPDGPDVAVIGTP